MRASRAGFTLLETLISMAIAGLAISVILMVGARGAFRGFMLGNRAIATMTGEVSRTAYRDVVGDILIPPIAVAGPAAEEELQAAEIDDSFVGAPDRFAGYLVAGRDSPCAPVGTEGRVEVWLEKTGDIETTVWCQMGDADPQALMRLRWTGAVLSYSEDGATWFEDWEVARGAPVEDAVLPNGEMRKVLVRLASPDGQGQIVELAASGRTLPQFAPGAG